MRTCALVVTLLLGAGAQASPYVPKSGAEVIEVLPQRASPLQRELRTMRSSLARNPRDVELAALVAERYIDAGRSETDPRYYGYAQAALAPWWNDAAPPARIRVLRATLMQATHHFDKAVTDLRQVTAMEPDNAQAWLTLATVQGVLGEYRAAASSCARLYRLAEPVVSATCAAQVGSLTGRLAESERLLADVYERSQPLSPGLASWTGTVLGEMAARRGDFQLAERRFIRALQATPDDSYLLGAYADLLLDMQRYEEARTLLEPYKRIDSLLLRYAQSLKLGRSDDHLLRAATAELDARFRAAHRRGDSVHLREEARHLLHIHARPSEALGVAERNWRIQKEPADARILLEAARAAQRPGAAQPVMDFLKSNQLQDRALTALVRHFEAGGHP